MSAIALSPFDGLPPKTEVVIIGGGIVGAVTALELAERGIPVVLCEKGRFGAEQSGLNFGWCRQLGRDVRELPLSIQALKLWDGMNERIQAETGFRRGGIVQVASSEEECAAFRARIDGLGDVASQLGLHCLTGNLLASLLPGAATPLPGALYCPTDGRAEPTLATSAILAAAQRCGAVLLEHCAVRGFEFTGGRISAVATEHRSIRCSSVVLAGGLWSRHLLRSVGVPLPQLIVSETLLRTTPVDLGHVPAMTTGRIAHRPRLDGGFVVAHEANTVAEVLPASFRYAANFVPALRKEKSRLRLRMGRPFWREVLMANRWKLNDRSPFEQFRTLRPEPSEARVLEAWHELQILFPKFRDARITEIWSGYIDVMPDAIPVISQVPQIDGLWIATGFSGHGFGVAPAAGRLAADLVTGASPSVDPGPFSMARFSRSIGKHSAQNRSTNPSGRRGIFSPNSRKPKPER